jgi:hypothetical protein
MGNCRYWRGAASDYGSEGRPRRHPMTMRPHSTDGHGSTFDGVVKSSGRTLLDFDPAEAIPDSAVRRVSFLDASGVWWLRDEHGQLVEHASNPVWQFG